MTNFIVISIIATMIGIWLSITLLSAIKFSVLEREEMHKFHTQALKSLIRMHPHASKRIMTSLGHQF